jgi:phosphoribosylformylglycinamidine (FGAM) synthase PurS component
VPVAPLAAGWRREFPGDSAAFFGAAAMGGPGLGLTAVYDPVLARVRLAGSGLPYNVTRVEVWRYDTATLTNAVLVRGSGLAAGPGDVIRVDDYEFAAGVANTYELRAYAGSTLLGTARVLITPALGSVWLKNVARPYLNRAVTVTGFSDVAMPARGAVFEVLGRRDPIAVTEVRGSKRFELELMAADAAEAEAIELALSFGDTLFLHVPAGCGVPGSMHAFVGDVTVARRAQRAVRRYLTLPLTQVAAPAGAVVGSTVTWQGVLSAYPTWADLLAAKASWLDVLQSVSAPADEVVG